MVQGIVAATPWSIGGVVAVGIVTSGFTGSRGGVVPDRD